MTFLSYFLFWFYALLVLSGIFISCASAVLGGLIAYENKELDSADSDGIAFWLGVCACLTGAGGIIGCLLLSKFVLNPIFRSLPDLF